MFFRFVWEIACGIISLIMILIFGKIGMASLALLALRPVIIHWKKIEFDERELQVFYKAGNYTAGALILLIALTAGLKNSSYFSLPENWIYMGIALLLCIHGIIGYLFLRYR